MKRQWIADFFRLSSWIERGAIVALICVLCWSIYSLLKPEETQDFSQAQKRFGILLKHSGNVQLRRAGSFVWRPVQNNIPINNGDALKTAEASSAQIKSDGRDNIVINPSSLVVFNIENKGRSYDIKVGSLVDRSKKESNSTPIVKYVDRTRQRLRWSYPVQNQIWTTGSQDPIILAWSASLPEKLNVRIRHNGKLIVETQVNATQWKLNPVPGNYAIHIDSPSNPRAVIDKTITVAGFSAPEWLPIKNNPTQPGGWVLEWSSHMSQAQSEIKIVQGEEVLFKKRLKESSATVPVELVNAIKGTTVPAIAFVRTSRDGTSTAWSEPFVLNSKKGLTELSGQFNRQHVYLTYDEQKGVYCDKNIVWQQSSGPKYYTKIMIAKVEGQKTSWQNVSPATADGFCLPAPGVFNVQALGFLGSSEGNELLVARSLAVQVEADLYAPAFQTPKWRESVDGKFQPVLRHPAPYALQVEWLSPDAKTVFKRDKTSAWDWMTPATLGKKVRLRYTDAHGHPLSDWSALVARPVVSVHKNTTDASTAARGLAAVEQGPLSLAVHDTGALFLPDWHSVAWTEVSWDPIARASWYEVQTSYTPNFSETRSSEKIRANKMVLNVQDNRPIYWRARALGAPGETGPWTSAQVVRIQAINPTDPSVATRSSPESHHPPALSAPSATKSGTTTEQKAEKDRPANLP